ncbi:MAG TPA: branched-chain amino acid ABC transporter ATP-binding protein [Firmicutes bacterium]|nr:branched-chain amino acid ABC transporter ATP-binding protein [Bacillota bacterium]
MLEVKNINVAYGKIQVIWDLSLNIGNEVVGIFGPNGAGKTTLINAIVGIVKARSGQITFDGQPIHNLDTHRIARDGIVVVPQNRELFPAMTVKENLRLGASYIPHARGHMEESLEYVYSLFPILKEREKQLAGTMSGGQQRMLVIGRALMSRPKMLILDEPSLGLQPSLVTELFQKLKEIKESGMVILLAEQNVRQGLKVIDRGYVMENGRIALEGSIEQLSKDENIRRAYLGV